MSTLIWARNFSVSTDDIDYITNLLLERETPLNSQEIALALIERKLEAEAEALQERYQDAQVYDPANAYDVGQRVVFPMMDFATAVVSDIRSGFNPDQGEFNVMQLEFDETDESREFATGLTIPHKLNVDEAEGDMLLPGANDFTAEDVLQQNHEEIVGTLEQRLVEAQSLLYVTRKWFPLDLMIEINEGHLNLVEAVLDINGGGPLTTRDILDQIGGVGDASPELQIFSLNYYLNEDDRFDEVGPAGEVLWYLTRLEPEGVTKTPDPLRYAPIDYSRDMLIPEMQKLERELADELSDLDGFEEMESATVTLIYPHRRVGTLPLNPAIEQFFPTARRAPRIWVTLVDAQDGEEFTGWVVHRELYVYGLGALYRKHKLPIGGYVTVRAGDEPGKIIVDHNAYRPRTEYIPLIHVKDNQIRFENSKRAIGADYDDLMIVGVEELAEVEALAEKTQKNQRSLTSILKMLIQPLGRLTPQKTVHVKTLYSAVNILRRCPPGPIMATLNANPDFENVGGHYWKLTDS